MSESSKIKATAQEIVEELRKYGRGSRQGDRPSVQEEFGVYTKDRHKVVQKYKLILKNESGEYVYKLALALLKLNLTECHGVAYELIAGHREARESLTIKRIETLGAGIDNWGWVDFFCTNLVGQAWQNGQLSDGSIRRWARSSDQWWRRAAVVATVPLNTKTRGGMGDSARTLMICQMLVADKCIMVQKAISWALRTLVPWDRKAVIQFLADNEAETSARVKREVKRKLTTGKKNY